MLLVLLHFLRAEPSASGVHCHQKKKRIDTIHILDTCPLLEVSGNSCVSSLWGNGVLILIRKKKRLDDASRKGGLQGVLLCKLLLEITQEVSDMQQHHRASTARKPVESYHL